MAKFRFMGLFNARDKNEVTIAPPAEGPSFGVAPSGKWICKFAYFLAIYDIFWLT
jgi:hypothetical protein